MWYGDGMTELLPQGELNPAPQQGTDFRRWCDRNIERLNEELIRLANEYGELTSDAMKKRISQSVASARKGQITGRRKKIEAEMEYLQNMKLLYA